MEEPAARTEEGGRGSLPSGAHLACGACGHKGSSEATCPGAWLGRGEARQSVQGSHGGPSPAAAVLSVFRAAGSAHLSSHHQASKKGSQGRILVLLHWRRRETEPRDCVQALPGVTWEAAEGAGASGSPRTTAAHAASSSTLKCPPEESLGPSPVMLDYEERRVRASESRREGSWELESQHGRQEGATGMESRSRPGGRPWMWEGLGSVSVLGVPGAAGTG